MIVHNQNKSDANTINQILLTSRFIDGFWDRWLSHGVEQQDLKIRPHLTSLKHWVDEWTTLANEKAEKAQDLMNRNLLTEAEYMYRVSGLYFNLAQWIYPSVNKEKQRIYLDCQSAFAKADALSKVPTQYECFEVNGMKFEGRIRTPQNAKGCIIIINPFDSSKEELFSYEMDFIEKGFITISFDGPGQGETLLFQNVKATLTRWEMFIEHTIQYVSDMFSNLPIYLFGTSSGAAWSVFFSNHHLITKSVAISPAISRNDSSLPGYFKDRMTNASEVQEKIIPNLTHFVSERPLLLFHGSRDAMVSKMDIDQLRMRLQNCDYIEYKDEGHCCNFKLSEVRTISMKWFLKE